MWFLDVNLLILIPRIRPIERIEVLKPSRVLLHFEKPVGLIKGELTESEVNKKNNFFDLMASHLMHYEEI